MSIITVINSFLASIVGFSLLTLVWGQLPKVPRGSRLLALLTGFFCVGLVSYITSISAGVIAIPGTLYEKIVTFLLALFLVWGLVSVLGLSIVWTIILFIAIPSNLRRALGIVTALMAAIVFLSVLNAYFHWGWNFPDVFGLVSGLLALVLTLCDRYLAKQEVPASSSQ